MENYFNYFTEIEECFQRCRATKTLLSPLDWALIESWKEADYPLPAVLVGIERSFAKFQARQRKFRKVNSLAYCAQEVLRTVEQARLAETQAGAHRGPEAPAAAPFTPGEILNFLERNAKAMEKASQRLGEDGPRVLADDLVSAATTLREIAAREPDRLLANLEELEGRLTALEEKLTASLTRASSVELLADSRSEVARTLGPSRRKMTAAQIESLERQFLKKRLLEHYQVPRLSLFYL